MVKMNYKIIHFHNPPDTLIIIGIFWKLFGKKLVFDHHDLSPDLYLVKFERKPDLIHKILLFFENTSCNLVDYVIATNESYKKIEQDRCHIDADKIFIVRNGPNLNKIRIVNPFSNLRKNGITNVCYLGDINKQDGLDYLIEVMNKIVNIYKYKKIQLLVIGDGDYVPNIKRMSEDYSLSDFIIFTGFIGEQQKLNQYLSSIDIFVDTAPDTFLNHSSTFIKLMEYMVFKKPIVSFSLKESMYTLKDAGIFIEPNNCDEMAKSIINLIDNNELKEKMAEKSAKRITQFSWDVVSIPLIQLYQKLSNNI
jgi:glycosyltransferase involved in cell wall biosynthesis